jgi:trehalose/maltose hydrolase-like predicted phosphorylase
MTSSQAAQRNAITTGDARRRLRAARAAESGRVSGIIVCDWEAIAPTQHEERLVVGLVAELLRVGGWLIVRTGGAIAEVQHALYRHLPAAARHRLLITARQALPQQGDDRPLPPALMRRLARSGMHPTAALTVHVGNQPGKVDPELISTPIVGQQLTLRDPAAFRTLLADTIWRRQNTRRIHTNARDWLDAALQPPTDPAWRLAAGGEHYEPALETEVESRFALGNGFVGTRGALELPTHASQPCTFIAGLFGQPDRPYAVSGLVPIPDWAQLLLTVDGTRHSRLVTGAHGPTRYLDLGRGVLLGAWHAQAPTGQAIQLQTLRLVSQADRALAVQMVRITVDRPVWLVLDLPQPPVDAALEFRQVKDGVSLWSGRGAIWLVAIASSASLTLGRHRREPERHGSGWRWSWLALPGVPAILHRIVVFGRGSLGDESALVAQTATKLRRACQVGTRRLLNTHAHAWQSRYDAGDVAIDGDTEAQRAIRFAVHHLSAAANPDDDTISIGARALTGEAYHGHIFWDTECFLLPFYTYTWPAAARALLSYRYRTLSAARLKAARLGYRGALYAWESTDTGDEATPPRVLGQHGEVILIHCGTEEQHISADVALAVWRYWEATRDQQFLLDAGAEILLETARFWASRAAYEADNRYHIRGVIGPDEYHEGVDDNAYTNGMATWNLERGLETARLLGRRWPEQWATLRARLGLDEAELVLWETVATKLVDGFDPSSGLFEQFKGYFALEPIDLNAYATRRSPMDVILGAERISRSQVIKQADVVMLFANLWERYTPLSRLINYRYYEPRCGHGSSLSPAVHALIAARLGDAATAERFFHQAGAIDLDDSMGNAAGGVHIAALGGLWQVAVFGFGGLSFERDGLRFAPILPETWTALRFGIRWRGRHARCAIIRQPGQEELSVTVTLVSGRPLPVFIGATRHRLVRGAPWSESAPLHAPRAEKGEAPW